MTTELSIPNPEFLIKSIAEQGYTLETSIADLIDNSITADAKNIEILVNTEVEPFIMFIADDGTGMSTDELRTNMLFPSRSLEEDRATEDLGRFGLGMKTASFAQTRCFTVLSRKRGDQTYNGRTWDVEHLKKKGIWEVLVNNKAEIDVFISQYYELTHGFLNAFDNFLPNTIIIWRGLYKFHENDGLINSSTNLQRELTENTKEYLQLIFHRFMENEKALAIRLNNERLVPFNPFPKTARKISVQQKLLLGNKLSLEGFVLPNRSIQESKNVSEWTLTHKSLIDMEGMYIYRANRIIAFGGWNNIIKKAPRLQLARLRIEIGNGIDHLFHLNVSKSSIHIPFGERIGFIRYISELKKEAEKEYYNHEIQSATVRSTGMAIFRKVPTSNGMSIAVDQNFELVRSLIDTLTEDQKRKLKIVFKIIATAVNKIKNVHSDQSYISILENEGINEEAIIKSINDLILYGISKEDIINRVIPSMGIDCRSLPITILDMLKN